MKKLFFLFLLAGSQWMAAQNIMNIGVNLASLTPTEKVYNCYVIHYDQIVATQYSMVFDPQKMTFAGIRNSQVDNLSDASFGTPFPGSIVHSWYQPDLNPEDFVDSTVIYQIVFNVLEAGGSTLCFSNSPLEYEFVRSEEELINEFYLHDDCFSGTILIDPTTGVYETQLGQTSILKDIFLSTNGDMTFSLKLTDQLRFTLYDATGKEIGGSNTKPYSTGRSTVHFGQPLHNEIYLIKVTGTSGLVQTIKAFAK